MELFTRQVKCVSSRTVFFPLWKIASLCSHKPLKQFVTALSPSSHLFLPPHPGQGGRQYTWSPSELSSPSGFQELWVVFSSHENERKLRVLETWQGISLWQIYGTELSAFLGLPKKQSNEKFSFPPLLLCLGRKGHTFPAGYRVSLVLICKDIRGLHSWTSAAWDRGNLPPVRPLCMKPLLHHQEKIVFLTLLLQTQRPKCLFPSSFHVAPYCFSELVEIIQE